MNSAKEMCYEKRAVMLVKNLKARHFDAVYCKDKNEALQQALKWIPDGATVGWGGALSAAQIGLINAVKNGNYHSIDRNIATTAEERDKAARECLFADVFLSGANAITLNGEMVNIDGIGNRVAAIIYGPKSVIVIAGMNKVVATLDDAITRARTIAAPMNQQRFMLNNPCSKTGVCADCKSEESICNQIVITRNCRPAGRIKFILVGEDLGF